MRPPQAADGQPGAWPGDSKGAGFAVVDSECRPAAYAAGSDSGAALPPMQLGAARASQVDGTGARAGLRLRASEGAPGATPATESPFPVPPTRPRRKLSRPEPGGWPHSRTLSRTVLANVRSGSRVPARHCRRERGERPRPCSRARWLATPGGSPLPEEEQKQKRFEATSIEPLRVSRSRRESRPARGPRGTSPARRPCWSCPARRPRDSQFRPSLVLLKPGDGDHSHNSSRKKARDI